MIDMFSHMGTEDWALLLIAAGLVLAGLAVFVAAWMIRPPRPKAKRRNAKRVQRPAPTAVYPGDWHQLWRRHDDTAVLLRGKHFANTATVERRAGVR